MSENQDKPEENLPDKEQQPIPDAQPTSSLTTQPQQPMEVHHHGHVHEKIKWKEYLFQFVMLFLAVFLGFLAENFREKGVERHIEREYIESLVKDMVTDSRIAAGNASDIYSQIKGIDSLQEIFSDEGTWSPGKADSMIKQCYKLTRHIQTFYSQYFNENTINQLLGTGSMRLIKKEGVAERIMGYHALIKFVEVQKQMYVTSVNECSQSMDNIYNIDFLRSTIQDGGLMAPVIDSIQGISLLQLDNQKINKFNSKLEFAKRMAAGYRGYLIKIRDEAEELKNYLRETYGIKE